MHKLLKKHKYSKLTGEIENMDKLIFAKENISVI
jgi:hypothetical protein